MENNHEQCDAMENWNDVGIYIDKRLTENKIPHTDTQVVKLICYMGRILNLNKSVNLTAITDPKEFVDKHYVDSVMICNLDEFKNADTVLDLGTGAGFPGIPLAILNPEKKFLLVDSLKKRIKIINDQVEILGINNVTAIHGRAEDLARKEEYREKFDLCISRAVANFSTLSEYCIPFVKVGGRFLAYKGPSVYEEVDKGNKAVEILGGIITEIKEVNISNLEHNIVRVLKKKNTPKKYPRNAGIPAKQPL